MVCMVTWNNKAFHLIAHTNQKMYTISSIWHKNMHQHLFVTIIIWCETLTIFWEESSRKTQSYKEQFHLAYCHAKKCTQYQYIQKMYTISIHSKNVHNILHLAQKYAPAFVRDHHHLMWDTNNFLRGKFQENTKLQGTVPFGILSCQMAATVFIILQIFLKYLTKMFMNSWLSCVL